MEVEIPLTRDMILNANARLHWSYRARLTKGLRMAAWAAGRAAKITVTEWPVRVVVTYHYPTRRRPRDEINLSPTTKALVDGLTDVGTFWPDDSTIYVRGQDTRIDPEPTGDPLGRIMARVSITPA